METISKSIEFEHSISKEALAFLPFVNDDEHSEGPHRRFRPTLLLDRTRPR